MFARCVAFRQANKSWCHYRNKSTKCLIKIKMFKLSSSSGKVMSTWPDGYLYYSEQLSTVAGQFVLMISICSGQGAVSLPNHLKIMFSKQAASLQHFCNKTFPGPPFVSFKPGFHMITEDCKICFLCLHMIANDADDRKSIELWY